MTIDEKIAYILQLKKDKEEAKARDEAANNEWKKEQEDKQRELDNKEKSRLNRLTFETIAASIALPAIIMASMQVGDTLGAKLVKALFSV
jgi:hypothetical protein